MHDLKNIPNNNCFYSDTDSVFLEKPLPEYMISPNKLGLCKLEKDTINAIFLAPKIYIYTYQTNDNKIEKVIKFKGVTKEILDTLNWEWFLEKYKDSSTFRYERTSNFLKTLTPPRIFCKVFKMSCKFTFNKR